MSPELSWHPRRDTHPPAHLRRYPSLAEGGKEGPGRRRQMLSSVWPARVLLPCLPLLTHGAVCGLAWAMLRNPGDALGWGPGAGAEWGLLLVLCSWLREIVWLCQPWEGVWFVLLLMPWRREVRGQRDREEGNGWGWQVALKRLTASRQQPWVMLA